MSRPASRAYRATVTHVTTLSASFARITFTGEDLQHFGSGGFDQRIKVLFPHPDGSWGDFGLFDDPQPPMAEWYQRWRQLPDHDRNTMRTYTVRAVRPDIAEVDVDFVLHGTTGPASAWATRAAPGDEVAIVGPDRRADASAGGGVEWRPGTARRVLLAGDETAAPAICAIVESLDEQVSGLALIEVPSHNDVLPVPTRSGVEVRWLARDGAVHGSLLGSEVRRWGAERGEYAWLAGEAGVITGLRRHLVRDLGLDPESVAFMGYWRHGRSES